MRIVNYSPVFRPLNGLAASNRFVETDSLKIISNSASPPFNIEQQNDHEFRISIAVAGFRQDNLHVSVTDNILEIRGNVGCEETSVNYLHRGLDEHPFEHRFKLAKHMKVAGADLANGILQLRLIYEVPEEKKPRSIVINSEMVSHKTAA
tara:strand:+ start:104 stop:553 length:450 start_codon:yes stop_codon:yes gene_type:complete